MKKILSLLALAILVVAGCSKYDDSDLQRRVSALESLSSYQALLQKLDAGKTVTSYSQSGTDIILNFSDGTSVTIDNKPAADNPIRSVTADGSTLTITLTDGTVVPVTYGANAYGIEVGSNGRKYYTFFEEKEAELRHQLTIPYTLSGDLKSIDDVTIIPNITVLDRSDATLLDVVTINPVDAKSGNIIIKQLDGTYDNTGEEYARTRPGYKIDFMAYFPDGTTRVKTIEIMGEVVRLSSNELTLWPLGANQLENDSPIPAEGISTSLYMEVWVGPHFSNYDGPEFYNWKFSELFGYTFSDTYGTITPTETPTISAGDIGYNDGGYRVFHYDIGIDIKKNNRPLDQNIGLTFYKTGKTASGGAESAYLTSVRFVQEHN